MRLLLAQRILLLLSAVFLSGCYSMLAKGSGQPGSYGTVVPSAGHSQEALNYATWVNWAKASIGLRAARLDSASPLVKSLGEACRKGRLVTVLLHVGGRDTASALSGTCAQIYLTDYPDLQFGPPVLLADGIVLVAHGNVVAMRNHVTQREYLFQQSQKLLSGRIQ